MIGRIAAALLLLPAIAIAQAVPGTDIGVWATGATYRSTSAPPPDSAIEVRIAERFGYGVSLTHFLGRKISVALAANDLRGRAQLAQNDFGITLDAGPMRVRAYSALAQWHFTPPWLFDIYGGAGVARMTGGRIEVPAEATEEQVAGRIGFRNATVPVLNLGVRIPIRKRLSAGIDAKWMRYQPQLETTPDDPFQRLKLNPVTLAFGVRFEL